MAFGHAESSDRVPFEIELDQNHGLLADNPAVVAGVDSYDLRGFVFDHATVGIFDVDLAAHEEPDVRVHAEVGADGRLHIDRPAEPWRIHHALDPSLSGTADLETHVTDFAEFRTPDWRERRRRFLGSS